MTDVEILAIEEAVVSNKFNYPIFGIILTFLIAIIATEYLATFGTTRFIDDIPWLGIILAIAVGVCVLAGWITNEPQYETQYKVTVSDEVSMNEFFEHYEIIDQEGKIYIVREKDGINEN